MALIDQRVIDRDERPVPGKLIEIKVAWCQFKEPKRQNSLDVILILRHWILQHSGV